MSRTQTVAISLAVIGALVLVWFASRLPAEDPWITVYAGEGGYELCRDLAANLDSRAVLENRIGWITGLLAAAAGVIGAALGPDTSAGESSVRRFFAPVRGVIWVSLSGLLVVYMTYRQNHAERASKASAEALRVLGRGALADAPSDSEAYDACVQLRAQWTEERVAASAALSAHLRPSSSPPDKQRPPEVDVAKGAADASAHVARDAATRAANAAGEMSAHGEALESSLSDRRKGSNQNRAEIIREATAAGQEMFAATDATFAAAQVAADSASHAASVIGQGTEPLDPSVQSKLAQLQNSLDTGQEKLLAAQDAAATAATLGKELAKKRRPDNPTSTNAARKLKSAAADAKTANAEFERVVKTSREIAVGLDVEQPAPAQDESAPGRQP